MLRKIPAALILACALVALPVAASAATSTPTPTPTPATSTTPPSYVPHAPPLQPTLAGSAAISVCDSGVPRIWFSVLLTDPDNLATGHDASLIMSDGSHSHTIPLGTLVNGKLTGTVLWPGASVGPDGTANGWPGWTLVDGKWVETSGNFAWTRSITHATLSVNPELVVPLSYPPESTTCETDPPQTTTSSSGGVASLSTTGVNVIPVAAAAVGVLLLGIVLAFVLRRRASTR